MHLLDHWETQVVLLKKDFTYDGVYAGASIQLEIVLLHDERFVVLLVEYAP